MIKITVFFEDSQRIRQLELTGHAGFADTGYDIVCAAVSSQVISVENSLHHLVKMPVSTTIDEVEGGYLSLIVPTVENQKQNEQSQLLLQHLVFALEVIAESYPDFVKIKHKNFIP